MFVIKKREDCATQKKVNESEIILFKKKLKEKLSTKYFWYDVPEIFETSIEEQSYLKK